jgi:hypothetical protein
LSTLISHWGLQVRYVLPANTDLLPQARSLEADALDERTMVLQACTGPDTATCESDAEIAFREKIAAIPGCTFEVGYVNAWNQVVGLFEVAADLVVDTRLNPHLAGHLRPGSWAPLGFGLYDFRTEGCLGQFDYGATTTFTLSPPPGYVGVVLDRQVDGFSALAWAIYVCVRVHEGTDPTEGLCQLVRFSDQSIQQAAAALLELGAKPDGAGGDALSPLRCCCAKYMNVALAEYLLEHGAGVDARASDGVTALIAVMDAMSDGLLSDQNVQSLIDLATLLLKQGADPNARDKSNRTPLDALVCIRWELLTESQVQLAANLAGMLIDNGADVNASGNTSGLTPMMELVAYGRRKGPRDPQLSVLKVLLDHGADSSLGKDWGQGRPLETAKMMATSSGLMQCAKLLSEDSNKKPPIGSAPSA